MIVRFRIDNMRVFNESYARVRLFATEKFKVEQIFHTITRSGYQKGFLLIFLRPILLTN